MKPGLPNILWRAIAEGDRQAWLPLIDLFIEESYRMLEVGQQYFIRTPTFYFLGLVVEADHWGVRLAPGAWQVNHLRNPDDLFVRHEFGPRDRRVGLPRGTRVPFHWLGPADPWDGDLAALLPEPSEASESAEPSSNAASGG